MNKQELYELNDWTDKAKDRNETANSLKIYNENNPNDPNPWAGQAAFAAKQADDELNRVKGTIKKRIEAVGGSKPRRTSISQHSRRRYSGGNTWWSWPFSSSASVQSAPSAPSASASASVPPASA